VTSTFPPFIPEEYQTGARAWTSRAINDLARALHPILAMARQEQVSDLPRVDEAASGLASPMYRSLVAKHEFSVTVDEVLNFDIDKFLATLYSIADDFGDQFVGAMFEHISEVCDENGQVVRVDGTAIFDALADALEKMDVAFDDDGNHGLVLAVNPETARKLSALTPTPEQEQRAQRILERKREEWRDSHRRRELP
jgi:hypothetical protein